GADREDELLSQNNFWGQMKAAGSMVKRYNNTQEGAVAMVTELLDMSPIVLTIQNEVAVQKKKLIDTQAGQSINEALMQLSKKHDADLAEIKKDLVLALKEKDDNWQKELEAARKKLADQIKANEESKRALPRAFLGSVERIFRSLMAHGKETLLDAHDCEGRRGPPYSDQPPEINGYIASRVAFFPPHHTHPNMLPKDLVAKKERLTLSQLASYDDILTDALVDHVYFWTTIRKNRSKYFLTRGFSEDDVTRILLYEVVVGKDAQKAETSLLKLPGLRKFMDRLKTDREKEDFRRHMRKYINIWLPDCPFEVSTTNRYTIVTHEAATTARRFIKKGETIKYLCGNLVAMTSEEEKDLDLTRRDFSIVMSSRKKTPSLFLGPARFANHDCDANARLVTRGSEGMQVVAITDINIDDEITVTYGEDYFGIENCECLCKTCESEGRNGWAESGTSKSGISSGTATPMAEEIDATSGPYSFRRKRKYGSCGDPISGSMTPDTEDGQSAKRVKSTDHLEVPQPRHSPSKIKKTPGGSTLRRELFFSDEVIPSTEMDFQDDQFLQDPVIQSEEIHLTPSAEDWSDQLRAAITGSVSQSQSHEFEYNPYGRHDLALLSPKFISSTTQTVNTPLETALSPNDSFAGAIQEPSTTL
ncbi:MAG: hypothetical protein Q9187_008426, partial [Circinaria calcarea]